MSQAADLAAVPSSRQLLLGCGDVSYLGFWVLGFEAERFRVLGFGGSKLNGLGFRAQGEALLVGSQTVNLRVSTFALTLRLRVGTQRLHSSSFLGLPYRVQA